MRWLDDWSTNSISNCRNNPIDLSHKQGSSTNCKKLTATRTAQNYGSHAQAAAAFNSQIHSGAFPHLLSAMRSGNYPTPAQLGNVESDLVSWGSQNFVVWLENTFGISPGGGGIGGGSVAPHATKGWADLQRSINQDGPTALRRIRGYSRATSTVLARKSRVRH